MESEPTHLIPVDLEAKLIEARAWCDVAPSPRIARPEQRQEWNAQGVLLLLDIVDIVTDCWDFDPEAVARVREAM